MKKYNNIIQGTPEWHHKRLGKVSGTVLKSIMGTPKAKQDQIYDTVAESLIVGDESEEYENPMDRGTRLQSDAIAAFELETGKVVEETGYIENDENPKIGYSPDGIISDIEDLEIKCPLKKNYIKMWLTNEVPDEYLWQMVQAFIVNPKLEKRYFIGYHPGIEIHPLHIIEVNREEIKDHIESATKKQNEFLQEVDVILKSLIKEL